MMRVPLTWNGAAPTLSWTRSSLGLTEHSMHTGGALTRSRSRMRDRRSATAKVNGGSAEHKAAFEVYVRSGENTNLRVLESKALSAGSNPDGGFLVPPEIEVQISQRLIAISPIRSIAGMRTISSNIYKKPFMTTG